MAGDDDEDPPYFAFGFRRSELRSFYLDLTKFYLPCNCDFCEGFRRLDRLNVYRDDLSSSTNRAMQTMANSRSVNKHFDDEHYVVDKKDYRFVPQIRRRVIVELNNGDKIEVIRNVSLQYYEDDLKTAISLWRQVGESNRYHHPIYPSWHYYHTMLPTAHMIRLCHNYFETAHINTENLTLIKEDFRLRNYKTDRCYWLHRHNNHHLGDNWVSWRNAVELKTLNLPDGPYDYQTVYRLGTFWRLPSFFDNY